MRAGSVAHAKGAAAAMGGIAVNRIRQPQRRRVRKVLPVRRAAADDAGLSRPKAMIWETHETRPSTISAVHRRVGTQNRENNPMQSRIGPDPAALVLRPGHQKKVVPGHG